MIPAAKRELELGGESTRGAYDHDLIHALSRRLDMLRRYDRYIANAKGQEEVKQFWSDMKDQSQQIIIKRLKELLAGKSAAGASMAQSREESGSVDSGK